jgi:beta-glucanase (GH16 family)
MYPAPYQKVYMYKKLSVLLGITCLIFACSSPPSEAAVVSVTEQDGWKILWQDEFDGTQLNSQNWTYDIGSHGWGNQEWQTYTDRPENIRVEGGMLVIEARLEDESFGKHPYSSARIKTEGLHAWQYARIEARMRLPYGQGIWPAFWMMGDDFEQVRWPQSGEIDIMEQIGREPNHIHGTMHGPGYSGSNSLGTTFLVSADSLRNDFHVYAVEWQENEIRWLFDEQEYFRVTAGDVPGEWVFDHPFFLILNLSVGGEWAGYPDYTTTFPQYLYVDYVRVYQRP